MRLTTSPRPHLASLAAALLTLLAACGGDAPSPVTAPEEVVARPDSVPIPAPTTGALEVVVLGLPERVAARVVVAAPNGVGALALAASATLEALAPAAYSVAADTVVTSGTRWAPDRALEIAQVSAGSRIVVPVRYARVHPGTLRLAMSGVPAPRAARWELRGANAQLLHAGEVLAGDTVTRTGLPAGTYIVTWHETRIGTREGTHTYQPATGVHYVTVPDAATPVNVLERYALTSGTLALGISGAPAGARVHWLLGGGDPDGGFLFQGFAGSPERPAYVSARAGDWVIEWRPLLAQVDGLGHTLVAATPRQPVTIVPSLDAVAVTMPYVIATGVVKLDASMIAAGRGVAFELKHEASNGSPADPEGLGIAFMAGTLDGGTTRLVSNVRPGRWTVRWFDVDGDPASFRPRGSTQVIEVAASWTPVLAPVPVP